MNACITNVENEVQLTTQEINEEAKKIDSKIDVMFASFCSRISKFKTDTSKIKKHVEDVYTSFNIELVEEESTSTIDDLKPIIGIRELNFQPR